MSNHTTTKSKGIAAMSKFFSGRRSPRACRAARLRAEAHQAQTARQAGDLALSHMRDTVSASSLWQVVDVSTNMPLTLAASRESAAIKFGFYAARGCNVELRMAAV